MGSAPEGGNVDRSSETLVAWSLSTEERSVAVAVVLDTDAPRRHT